MIWGFVDAHYYRKSTYLLPTWQAPDFGCVSGKRAEICYWCSLWFQTCSYAIQFIRRRVVQSVAFLRHWIISSLQIFWILVKRKACPLTTSFICLDSADKKKELSQRVPYFWTLASSRRIQTTGWSDYPLWQSILILDHAATTSKAWASTDQIWPLLPLT